MLGVVRHTRHNLARRPIFEVADRQPLQRAEDVTAQIVDDRLLQAIIESDAERREGSFQGIGCGKTCHHPRQQGRLFGLNHIVDDPLDQPGRKQFHGRRTGRSQQRQQCQSAVRAEIVEDAEEGFHKVISWSSGDSDDRGRFLLPVMRKLVELSES